jgi:hypothetical protein
MVLVAVLAAAVVCNYVWYVNTKKPEKIIYKNPKYAVSKINKYKGRWALHSSAVKDSGLLGNYAVSQS